jgi:hypothetical protein
MISRELGNNIELGGEPSLILWLVVCILVLEVCLDVVPRAGVIGG